MAWIAVDKDQSECICNVKPFRFVNYEGWGVRDIEQMIQLPKGSIKKLIGKELTWEDNPVELKEE